MKPHDRLVRLVTMNPTRGNNPVDDASTVANTRRTVLELANISIEAVDRK